MSLKEMMDQVKQILKDKSGLDVVFDPQPVRTAAPSLRLTYLGSEHYGIGHSLLKWQLSLIGAGDGPDVYLSSVIAASLRLEALYDRCKGAQHIDFPVGKYTARLCFEETVTPTGSFSQNGEKIVETGQWTYLWTEPRYITVNIPDEVWEKGE